MEAGVGDAGQTAFGRDRQGREGQDQEGVDNDAQSGELHLPALDLLAQVLGGTADHQAAQEHAQHDVHDHVHQAHALAAEHAVEHHVQQGHHAAQGCQGVVHVVDGAGGEGCSDGGEQGGLGDAEADLLALHAAHGLAQANLRQLGVARQLREVAQAQAHHENDAHGHEHGAALAAEDGLAVGQAAAHDGVRLVSQLLAVVIHQAEHDHAGAGQDHHAQQLGDVGDDGGVLQRGGGVGAQETAAVGTQVLDGDQGGDGAHGDVLLGALDGGHRLVGHEILGSALPHQDQCHDNGEGDQDAGGDPHQVHKEIADILGALSRKAPDKGDARRVAAGRGHKHHENNDQHLREIAQAALPRVVLQVGVGHEADDGIERQRRLHVPDSVGVKKRKALNAQDQVANRHHHAVGSHQGQRILFPVHALMGIPPSR